MGSEVGELREIAGLSELRDSQGAGEPRDSQGAGELRDSQGLTEQEFLAAYDPSRYPRPSVTVDIALFVRCEAGLELLLIKRGGHPWLGQWALPGGFVNPDETLEQAAARELWEETGVSPELVELRQLQCFSDPGRDPRTRVITCAFWAVVDKQELLVGPQAARLAAGDDAAELGLYPVEAVLQMKLACDHDDIVRHALRKVL